jgi:hypothetical protein
MSCRQWSTRTGISASGLCSFEMVPETANPTKSCSICLTPEVSQRIATLRAFNVDNGQLLWEKINYGVIGKSPSGAVYGYRARNVTLGKEYEYIAQWFIPVTPAAAVFNSTTEFQTKTTSTADRSGQTWSLDCVKVDISGAETLVMQDAVRSFVEGGSPDSGSVAGGTGMFQSYFDAGPQLYNCSDDGLYIGYRNAGGFGQFMVEMTDMQKRVTKHTLRILPGLAFPMGSNAPKWVVKCGTTVAKFGLYADAAEVETELATLEGVIAVTAVGGPLCQEMMDIDIEFDNVDRRFSHMCIEWASADRQPGDTVGILFTAPIWSLATHTLFAPLTLKTLRSDTAAVVSFAPGLTGVIASGSWGPLNMPGINGRPKRALSLLSWNDTSSVPNWRTINQKVWEVIPFDGMIQTQEWLETGNERGRGWGVTAIANGKIAVCAVSQREPVLDGGISWNTHLILDAASGASSGYGYSGFLSGTRVLFCEGDNQYRTGLRHGFTPSGRRADYATPLYIESYGTDPNLNDLRETDATGAYGVGTKQVGGISGWSSKTLAQNFRTEELLVSPQAAGSGYSYTAPWLVGTTGTIPAQTGYPWGSFRRDFVYLMSSFTRFSASTEWQLLHGSYAGGTFFAQKQTSWFSLYVSLDTVKDELEAWYGSIAGGGSPIVYVNPFGDSPDRESASPPLPTWQRINEIWVYRDANLPNPFSPLAPRANDTWALKLRNKRKIMTHPLIGQNPETGEIVWQRDIGMHPTIEDEPVGGNIVALSGNRVVVTTRCKAGVDTPIFPRGT